MACWNLVPANLLALRPVLADFYGSWTYYGLLAAVLLGVGGLLWYMMTRDRD